MILPDAHLVVEESVGLALDHFEDGGRFLVEHQDPGLLEVLLGPDLSGGSLTDRHGPAGSVEIRGRRETGFFPCKHGQADGQVRI